MGTMETEMVSKVSEGDRQRVGMIVDAAGRMFLAPGPGRVNMDELATALGMSKKTVYRYFPDKHSLLTAVLDQRFGAMERRLAAAVEDSEGKPFGDRVQRFLIEACDELAQIGAAQLATGRGDALLRRHVEERIDAVVYQRLDELFQDGHRRGLLSAAPELLGEITRGAVERLLNSSLPRELNCTAADLLRATIDTVLYGAIRPGDDTNNGNDGNDKERKIGS